MRHYNNRDDSTSPAFKLLWTFIMLSTLAGTASHITQATVTEEEQSQLALAALITSGVTTAIDTVVSFALVAYYSCIAEKKSKSIPTLASMAALFTVGTLAADIVSTNHFDTGIPTSAIISSIVTASITTLLLFAASMKATSIALAQPGPDSDEELEPLASRHLSQRPIISSRHEEQDEEKGPSREELARINQRRQELARIERAEESKLVARYQERRALLEQQKRANAPTGSSIPGQQQAQSSSASADSNASKMQLFPTIRFDRTKVFFGDNPESIKTLTPAEQALVAKHAQDATAIPYKK